MNGQSLIDQVLRDSFPPSRRAEALQWVQYRVGLIWANDEWEFVQATKLVAIASGQNTLTSLPGDMGPVVAVIPPNRDPLTPIDEFRDFADMYIGPGAMNPGLPEAFTVLNGVVYVGPTSTETKTDYRMVYEKTPPTIVDDTTAIPMPAAFEGTIVDAGKARGFTLTNNPLGAGFEANCQAGLVALRRLYLRSMRGTSTQAPAYRPGGIYGWQGWGW